MPRMLPSGSEERLCSAITFTSGNMDLRLPKILESCEALGEFRQAMSVSSGGNISLLLWYGPLCLIVIYMFYGV